MTIENERTHFYQWDLNQRLIVDDYAAGTELHFVLRHQNIYSSLRCEGFEASVVETYAEGEHIYANIPNLLLQCPGDLLVYVYLTQGEESHTAAEATFIVKPRRRPADYIYTETEIKRWADLDARIDALEKNGTGSEVPVFDLVSLGLPTLDAGSGATVRLETDTTEILNALTNHMVRLVVNISYRGLNFQNVSLILNPTGMESASSWLTATIGIGTLFIFVNLSIDQTSITANAICNNLPVPTTADNGKVLQVVDGAWKAVAVEDSAVATFVDDYINEALGGDY